MPSIAEMALAAHAAEQQATELERAAKLTRARALAESAIVAVLRPLGIDPDLGDIQESAPGSRATFELRVAVDDDATLRVTCEVGPGDLERATVEMTVVPAEQLYWDLPAGQTARVPGAGGVYGCYGLSANSLTVASLASLGAAILRVRNAREDWTRKHAAELDGLAS